MTISVSNNSPALLALQTLNRTTEQLSQVQDQISTNLKVASPSDNPTVWANAQGQTNEINSLGAVTSGLNRATSIADVALSSGQQVVDLLNQIKTKVLAAQDQSITTSDRAALNTDFTGLLQQLQTAVSSADFDGVNLLDGSQAASPRFITTADASQTVTLPTPNMSLSGSIITLSSTASINYLNVASAVMDQVNASITNVNAALSSIGDQANLVTAHSQLVSSLSSVLQSGVDQLTNFDSAADSARLTALKVQQQIGQQSLSIANSMPQILLSLFK
jgi:flagellin